MTMAAEEDGAMATLLAPYPVVLSAVSPAMGAHAGRMHPVFHKDINQ